MTKTIYIIDDEPNICELVKYNLQREGYKVKTFESGEDGISEIHKNIQIYLYLILCFQILMELKS